MSHTNNSHPSTRQGYVENTIKSRYEYHHIAIVTTNIFTL